MSTTPKAVKPRKAAKRRNRVLPPLDPTAFSLEAYMADDKTRVFNFNGRKLVSILGREDFPGERLCKLPPKVLEFANRQPLTAALLPGRIGYFPKARGQKVTRPNGDWAFTLLFCLDGVGMLEVSQSRHRLTGGTFALLRPFEFHAYEADAHHPWSYYWIHFSGTMAQQYYELLTSGGKNTCIGIESNQRFIESFEKILNIYHEGHAYKMLVQASSALHQLLGDLYGQVCSRSTTQETVVSRIERTLLLMRNNLSMHLSIPELAGVANMSHAYYALQFRRHTGESPRSYFNKMKIAKACEYLEKTGSKVESIAHLVGYEDSFYFCRLFRRLTGQSPTIYRQSHRPGPGPSPVFASTSGGG
jgi:AraC family transcriptional regulator of arabinose operon